MAFYIDNDALLIHCFQDCLSGESLDWYMGLERSKIWTWKDLFDAFLKQYKYNLDMAPTRLQLQNQAQRNNESFKEYVKCWRETTTRVQPPLSNSELVEIFMNILQGSYFGKMVESMSSNFSELVTIGERIENGLNTGGIPSAAANHQT